MGNKSDQRFQIFNKSEIEQSNVCRDYAKKTSGSDNTIFKFLRLEKEILRSSVSEFAINLLASFVFCNSSSFSKKFSMKIH